MEPQVQREDLLAGRGHELAPRSGVDAAAALSALGAAEILVPVPEAVKEYISCYPDLGRLLPDVCGYVRQAFGFDVELSLELYRDPESNDRYLTLYVRQAKYEAAIMDRIEAVCQKFNHKLEEVPGYLLLTTDFRRPRGKNAV
jgi:hypothetical protein